MVSRGIKILRFSVVVVLTLFFVALLCFNLKTPELSLVKAILPEETAAEILPVSEKTSSSVNLIFEKSDDDIEPFVESVMSQINKEYFEIPDMDISKMPEYYSSSPSNFLSAQTRKELAEENYETVYNQGLERLYNPAGIMFSDFSKDPLSLTSDFLLSLNTNLKILEIDGKYYDIKTIKLKKGVKTDAVKELVEIQKQYKSGNDRLYLSGTPVHTYLTEKTSALNVNIICVLITLLVIVLTYLWFKRLKLLLPIALSIAFGFLGGISVAKATFHDFHIITLLFAMTLIGIGLDYSLHYIFSVEKNEVFYKNLTLSLVSTIIAFGFLFLLKIEILNQIALFTISGLLCVYLFILLIYPCLNFSEPIKNVEIKFNKPLKVIVFALAAIVIAVGMFKISFDDSLSALYTPKNELKQAEKLYSNLSNPEGAFILTIIGNDSEDLKEREETVGEILEEKGVNYISLSKFAPSLKRQRENFELVKKLYEQDYLKDILTPEQLEKLRAEEFSEVSFDTFSYLNDFMLSPSSSLMIYFAPQKVEISLEGVKDTDLQITVSEYLKKYRIELIKILPFVYLLLAVFTLVFYGRKQFWRMIIPIILSPLFTLSLISMLGGKLNLFHFLGLMLVLGFTLDYSLFSTKRDTNTQNAIFLACLTTSASFVLLSFTTFNLLNSLALTLSIGIISSYIFLKSVEQ